MFLVCPQRVFIHVLCLAHNVRLVCVEYLYNMWSNYIIYGVIIQYMAHLYLDLIICFSIPHTRKKSRKILKNAIFLYFFWIFCCGIRLTEKNPEKFGKMRFSYIFFGFFVVCLLFICLFPCNLNIYTYFPFISS